VSSWFSVEAQVVPSVDSPCRRHSQGRPGCGYLLLVITSSCGRSRQSQPGLRPRHATDTLHSRLSEGSAHPGSPDCRLQRLGRGKTKARERHRRLNLRVVPNGPVAPGRLQPRSPRDSDSEGDEGRVDSEAADGRSVPSVAASALSDVRLLWPAKCSTLAGAGGTVHAT
jgi:hypothetical protein